MSRRKHELQTNELLNVSTSAREFVARNLLVIVLTAGVVISAWLIVNMLIARSRDSAAGLWREFLNARTSQRAAEPADKFREDHPGSPLAQVAAGDAKLQGLLHTGEADSAKAAKAVDDAEALFHSAENSGDRYAKAHAWLGLGSAAEFRAAYEPAKYGAHLEAARGWYDKVIGDFKGDAAALEAARRKTRLTDYADAVKLSRRVTDFKAGPLSEREIKDEGFGHPDFRPTPRSKSPLDRLPPVRPDPAGLTPKKADPKSPDTPDIGPLPAKTDAGKSDPPLVVPPPPPLKKELIPPVDPKKAAPPEAKKEAVPEAKKGG